MRLRPYHCLFYALFAEWKLGTVELEQFTKVLGLEVNPDDYYVARKSFAMELCPTTTIETTPIKLFSELEGAEDHLPRESH